MRGALLLLGSIAVIAASAGEASAQDASAVTPVVSSTPWAKADYLFWHVSGDSAPALVSNGPLAAPNAQVGFGASTLNRAWSSGVRGRGGAWLGTNRRNGVEGEWFILHDISTAFADSSNGNPTIARPFVNAQTSQPDALLVASALGPGSVTAMMTSRLFGGGANFTQAFCSNCAHRIRTFVGYRFLRLTDHLDVSSHSQATVAGTSLTNDVADDIATTSVFHGVNAGVSGNWNHGAWFDEWHAALATGVNRTGIAIGGSTTTTTGAGAPVMRPGGLLALSSNSGTVTDSRGGVVIDLAVEFGARISKACRIFGGYTWIDWRSALRPGGVIDTVINPNLLPPATVTGPSRPALQKNPADVVIHGFNIGAVFGF